MSERKESKTEALPVSSAEETSDVRGHISCTISSRFCPLESCCSSVQRLQPVNFWHILKNNTSQIPAATESSHSRGRPNHLSNIVLQKAAESSTPSAPLTYAERLKLGPRAASANKQSSLPKPITAPASALPPVAGPSKPTPKAPEPAAETTDSTEAAEAESTPANGTVT